jgi:hypothetical protein
MPPIGSALSRRSAYGFSLGMQTVRLSAICTLAERRGLPYILPAWRQWHGHGRRSWRLRTPSN